MKRTLSLILALVMILGMIPVFAAPVDDAGTLLKNLGVLKGDAQGNLMLYQELKRQDSVVMLSRLLGEEAVAKAYTTKATWKDIRDPNYNPYMAWAQEKGYFKGHNNDTFGFGETITVQDYALVLMRALGYTNVEWKDAYQKAIDLGLTTDVGATVKIDRGKMALMTVAALKTTMKDSTRTLAQTLNITMPVEKAEMTLKASGVRKLTVTFDKAAPNATFEVKKGNITVNVAKVEWNTAKTEATITTASNLTEGEYTVKASGVQLLNDTLKVKVENEKMAKFNFLGESLVLRKNSTTEASIGFEILNQYGENITAQKQGMFRFTPQYGTATTDGVGRLKITSTSPQLIIGQRININAVAQDGMNVIVENKMLTIAQAANISSISVVKLYHPTNKVLRQNETNWSDYKLVLDARDQYGNKVTDLDGGLYMQSIHPYIVNVAQTVTTMMIDGVNEAVVALAPPTGTSQGGQAKIMFTSLTTGAKTEFEVNVIGNSVINSINLSQPANAVAGERVEIPFTAYDQYGNAITDVNILNSTTNRSITAGTLNFVFDAGTNRAKLEANLAGVTQATQIFVTVTTNTGKVGTTNFSVQALAQPTTVVGLKNNITAWEQTYTTTLTADDIIVNDQYGRPYKYTGSYTITSSNPSSVLVNGTTIKAEAPGSSQIIIELTGVSGSAYSFTGRSVASNDSNMTYSLVGPDRMYSGSTRKLELVGKYSGQTVQLLPNKISQVMVDPTGIASSVEAVADGIQIVGNPANEGKITVRAVVAGNIVPKEVTLSKVAPYANSVKFVDIASYVVTNGANLSGNLEVIDQYGLKMASPSGIWTATPTTVATVSGTGQITKVANGTFTLSFVAPNGKTESIVLTMN